jgi:adenylate cyclase
LPQRTRKLAAIMFTDMIGYAALGQRDESLSLDLIEGQNKIIRQSLQKHNGREVKTMGDAFLVDFSNALDAVRSAYDIQRSAREFNASQPTDRRIRLRIGLHLGDVEESDGDVFGDAVNVASRIESLAEDGGVCLTRQVYDQVRNKFELELTSIGTKTLKNVLTPVEVFKVVMPWEQRESKKRGYPSARLERRRVAVLPFASMSPNPGDEYFADGLTEELIGVLSKIRELSVISRTSVMQYKGRPKSVLEVGKELNAGTIIEGSVRKAENRVRVTIQMIDATEDKHLWAESYDRELKDIFSVQSDIAGKVADALRVELLAGESEQIREAPTKNTEAHVLYLKGVYEADKGSPSDIERAIWYFESAVEKDPRFAHAYVEIAYNYVGIAGESMPASKAIPKAKEAVERALSLGAKLAEAYNAKAAIAFQYDWDWAEAEENFRKAISINPSLAEAHDWYGRFMASMGRFDEALSEMSRAYELDPASPFVALRFGLVYWMAGDNERARDLLAKTVDRYPTFARARVVIAFIDAMEGKKDEALKGIDFAITLDDNAFFRTTQAMVLAYLGSGEEARRILEDLVAGKYKGYASPGTVGAIYYLLGDKEKGYDWMHRAYEEHDATLPMENRWPILDVTREDPRFVELLRRLKLA